MIEGMNKLHRDDGSDEVPQGIIMGGPKKASICALWGVNGKLQSGNWDSLVWELRGYDLYIFQL